MNKKQLHVSRRTFVKGLGVAMAAPYIIPASALGEVAPGKKITIGLIGCGGQGRGVMGGALGQKDTQVLAVCDVNQKNMAQAKDMVDKTYGNTDCRTYHDFRDLLACKDIDAVIIGTPDHWHALITIAAAKAKKHIYCEKPLTWCLAEGQAVVKAVRENGVVLQVGSMQRSGYQFKQACTLVRNGYIGKIKHIIVGLPNGGQRKMVTEFPAVPEYLDYDFYVGPAQWAPYHPERLDWNWRWWMGFAGGQMMDWIGHHGDIAHMAMGWDHTGPSKIEPMAWEIPKNSNLYNGPTVYNFHCTYANGTTMQMGCSKLLEKDTCISQKGGGTQWFGENGQWIWVNRGGIEASDKTILKAKFSDSDFTFRKERNHMRDWLDCVKRGKDPIAPVEAGHRSASIGHLCKIAGQLGQTLQWDPMKEVFKNNDMANRMLSRPYRGEWKLG